MTTQLFAVSVGTGKIKQISSGQYVFGRFSFSKDSSNIAFIISNPSMPNDVYISSVGRFEPLRLSNTNPQLQEIALGKTEVICWKSYDGLEIEGLLIKPVRYVKGQKYSLLTYVHGGPSGKFGISFSPQMGVSSPIQGESYPLHVFAGEGFAIFFPNPRGSYGGYMTSWIITQTDRFKAASLGAGMSNLISFYGQTDIPGFIEFYFKGDPWTAKEEYEKRSPLTYARNVKTPTLIQQGEQDVRVPLPQAQEFYRALKKNNIPVEFVIYPCQGHSSHEPKFQRNMMRLNLEWFIRWLKKGKMPSN